MRSGKVSEDFLLHSVYHNEVDSCLSLTHLVAVWYSVHGSYQHSSWVSGQETWPLVGEPEITAWCPPGTCPALAASACSHLCLWPLICWVDSFWMKNEKWPTNWCQALRKKSACGAVMRAPVPSAEEQPNNAPTCSSESPDRTEIEGSGMMKAK